MCRFAFFLILWLCAFGASAAYKTELHVAQDGSADFTTIQAAIDSAKAFPDDPITIHIADGIYEEKVKVHAWNNHLILKGESEYGVVIRWDDYFERMERGRNSTFHTATLLVQGDDVRLENLIVKNTAGPVGQAVALSVEADRCMVENCRLIGCQDTLYADGAHARQHYKNCYIEGTTDFIFGGATALFENCTIHSKANSYITAASTPENRPYGFVFLDCTLTAAEGVSKVYLGRPWRSFAKTVFVKCAMGSHIRSEGWHNWNSEAKEKTVFYAEGGNIGTGSSTETRVSWAKQLSEAEVETYTVANVLKPILLPKMEAVYPCDTSYTLSSAYAKNRKYHPFIEAVQYNTISGCMCGENISYATTKKRSLKLDVFSTQEKSSELKPAVLLIHGGGWSSGDRSLMHPLADRIAKHGYVAVTPEYRLSPEAPYPAAVDDLKQTIQWIQKNASGYGIDPDRIALLGCSAGAQLAGLVGLTTDSVSAIINIDGIMDFTSEEARKYEDDPARESTPAERWLGGRYADFSEVWKEASPFYHVDRNSPPILFINSSQERFHAGRDAVIEKLNEFSIYSEVHTFNDASHCFWLFDPWFKPTGDFVVQFLDTTLN